jgi:restriction system protein
MARRKKNDTFNDLVELVSMFPWWVGVLLAPISFVLANAWATQQHAAMLARPSATSGIFYALALLLKYAVPAACVIGSVVSAMRRHKRKELMASVADATSADALNGLSWQEFELLVGEGFRQKGYQVEELGGGGADGGVDLVLRKGGEKFLVQCKQWRAQRVGVIVIRELYGVMAASSAAGGFVVTSGRFTEEAQAFAKGRNVQLLDGRTLLKLLLVARSTGSLAATPTRAVHAVAAPPASVDPAPRCPRCAGPMVRREARKGPNAGEAFWGCGAFPKCYGTA